MFSNEVICCNHDYVILTTIKQTIIANRERDCPLSSRIHCLTTNGQLLGLLRSQKGTHVVCKPHLSMFSELRTVRG